MEIKDSGNRREFTGGGVRDMAEGKGACHLLPLDIVAGVYAYVNKVGRNNIIFNPVNILSNINDFIRYKTTKGIYDNIAAFAYWHYQTLETAMLEVAIHYEMGAKKYEPRNWERIMETDTFVDSATRHFFKFMRGDDDEPHDRAFLWNLLGLLWTVKQLAKKDIANDLQTGLFDTIRQNAELVTEQSHPRVER